MSIRTEDVLKVARFSKKVVLDAIADLDLVVRSNSGYLVLRCKKRIYGDTTGFGDRVRHVVPPDKDKEKQRNLVYSLNCGSGDNLRVDQVRAGIFVRLCMLAKGYSGVRKEVLEELCRMLNGNSVPEIPSRGSIGNSGDLIPSSYYAMRIMEKIGLEGREGLALVNGTHFSTGIAALVAEDFAYLYRQACEIIGVLFQCLGGIKDVFDGELHSLKMHKEEAHVARQFRHMLEGSRLVRNISELEGLDAAGLALIPPIQDRYSLRCLPQELGSVVRMFCAAEKCINNELNSVSDNPVISGGKIKHGGHFDGSYVADAVDHELKPAIRRLAHILRAYMRSTIDSKLNHGILPTYLVFNDDGLNNGLQGLAGLGFDADYYALLHETEPVVQYAHNDSEGVNQDILSLAMQAATTADRAIRILNCLVTKLMIISRQAVELLGVEEKLSERSRVFYGRIAKLVDFIDRDRSLHHDLRNLEDILLHHEF